MRKAMRMPGVLVAGLIALLAVLPACDRKPSPGKAGRKAGEATGKTGETTKATPTGGSEARAVQTPRPTPPSSRIPAQARTRPERG